MNFRKIAAASAGRLLLRYFTENTPEPIHPAPVDAAGTPVRVVTVPGKGHLTAPALECAVHALSFFAEYFGIPYPGEKLDLSASPRAGEAPQVRMNWSGSTSTP